MIFGDRSGVLYQVHFKGEGISMIVQAKDEQTARQIVAKDKFYATKEIEKLEKF